MSTMNLIYYLLSLTFVSARINFLKFHIDCMSCKILIEGHIRKIATKLDSSHFKVFVSPIKRLTKLIILY